MERRVFFSSPRVALLRGMLVFVSVAAAVGIWAVTIPPRAEWPQPAGAASWWILPAFLILLSLVLPLSFAWLHDRYVLVLEVEPEVVHVTTFLVWGRRTHTVARADLHGATVTGNGSFSAPALRFRQPGRDIDWLFDQQGDFPLGEEAVTDLAMAGAGPA